MSKSSINEVQSPIANAQSGFAVLIIDMLADFEFEDGAVLFENAKGILNNIRDLKTWARSEKIPVIYVNDNYGKWNENLKTYVSNLREGSAKARTILELIEPEDDDYFILKPQRSGFYATALGGLLMSLNVSNVILTGVTTDICILFTAHDAYMRGFQVNVPADCCAAVEEKHHHYSLDYLRRVADADTADSASICLPQSIGHGCASNGMGPSEDALGELRNEFRFDAVV